jgi:hypothetical protein
VGLQHIVLFAFPDDLSDEDSDDMRAQVASFPSAIGGMSRLRFGSDLSGERTRGYSRLMYMEFPGTAELVTYQQHPVHQAFQRWLVDRHCTPLAFDYYIDSDTVLVTEDAATGEEERR